MSKFTSFLGLVLLLFVAPVFVFAVEVKPEDYGAIVDDGVDDSEAIRLALNHLFTKGGGTISFPSGKMNINRTIRLVPEGFAGADLILRGTRGSVIEISVGENGTAFDAGNLNMLIFEDLIITGKNVPSTSPDFYDAKYVLYSTYVNQTNIIRCQFYGLAVRNNFAVIYAGNTDVRISDSQFDGNLASYPNGAVILAENVKGLTVSRTTFMDYANLHGTYISKTPSLIGAWISVKGGLPHNANGQRRIVIEDSRFDEGAATAITAENIAWLNITGISVNVNSTDAGRGMFLKNVEYANIAQSWFGYSANTRPALDFQNVKGADVTSLKFGGGVYFFKQFGTMKMNITFCPECVELPTAQRK
jgi:hypothetical protein